MSSLRRRGISVLGMESASAQHRAHGLKVYLACAVFGQLVYLIANKVWSAVPRMSLLTMLLFWTMLLYISVRGLHPSRGRALAWSASAAAGLTVLAWGVWRGTA
jgi:hypothetical protein